MHVIGLLAAILGFRPFIPAVQWDDAGPRAERGLEGGFIRDFFAARIKGLVFPRLGSIAPIGNEPPVQNGEFARTAIVIAHSNNFLRGANVVRGRQVNRALAGVSRQ